MSIYYMGGSGHRRYESRDVQSIGICGLLPPGFYALYGVILAAPLFDLSFNYTMYDTSHLSAIRAFLLSIVMIHDFVDDPALNSNSYQIQWLFFTGQQDALDQEAISQRCLHHALGC